MAIIYKPERTTLGNINNMRNLDKHIYDPEEIKSFQLNEAINTHPLAKKATSIRSKFAYRDILHNTKTTSKYLLPGQIVLFHYANPKYKEELEYYDATPLTLFFGITRTNDNVIREIGLNLHYYPPFTRARILEETFNQFRPFFEKNFNDPPKKPNTFISWDALKSLMNRNLKLAFGVKMYIPVLRGPSYVLPTRLLPTAFYTEGHFAKATLHNIFKFWRQFK